jgi:hypothetical protein
MSKNIPRVRRRCIHPGAVVVNVTIAHATSITIAAAMPRSMEKYR